MSPLLHAQLVLYSSPLILTKACPDYVSEAQLAAVQGEEAVEAALTAQRNRQRAWLKRKSGCVAAAAWRPAKRYRRAAFMYSLHEHAFMREFVEKGLLHFQQPEDEKERKPACSWNRLSVCPDMGSDGVSAISHWLGPMRLCVDVTWDFVEHGCHNDIMNAIADAFGPFYIGFQLLRYNIPHSPWDEGMRFTQSSRAADEILKPPTPKDAPLWSEYVDEMLNDESGRHCLLASDPEQALWDHLRDNHCLKTKGTKCIKGRYLNVVRETEKQNEVAGQRKFFYSHTCLELDLLGSGKFAKLVMDGADLGRHAGTDEAVTDEDKALKKACANQLVVGLMDWLSPHTSINDKLLVAGTQAWAHWMETSSRCLRRSRCVS